MPKITALTIAVGRFNWRSGDQLTPGRNFPRDGSDFPLDEMHYLHAKGAICVEGLHVDADQFADEEPEEAEDTDALKAQLQAARDELALLRSRQAAANDDDTELEDATDAAESGDDAGKPAPKPRRSKKK